MGPKHLSLYALTVKPRTQLYKMVEKGKRIVAPEKSIVEMMQINLEETKVSFSFSSFSFLSFLLIYLFLQRAGLNRYECSSYAGFFPFSFPLYLSPLSFLPSANGHECAHNIAYWTMGDYIGVGPGAYSRFCVGEGFESVKTTTFSEGLKGVLSGEGRTKRVGLRQVLSPQQWTTVW